MNQKYRVNIYQAEEFYYHAMHIMYPLQRIILQYIVSQI